MSFVILVYHYLIDKCMGRKEGRSLIGEAIFHAVHVINYWWDMTGFSSMYYIGLW